MSSLESVCPFSSSLGITYCYVLKEVFQVPKKPLSTPGESGVKKNQFQPIGSKPLKLHLLVLYHFYPVFGMVGFIQMPFLLQNVPHGSNICA